MKRRVFLGLLASILFSSLAGTQSLSEIARKEKERRKKNKEMGRDVQVITEDDLQPTGPVASSTVETGATSEANARSYQEPSREEDISNEGGPEGDVGEPSPPTEIPQSAPPREKLRIFDEMMKGYRRQVAEFDEEIAKNNRRLQEIQQELITIGASGIPIAPTADRGVRYEGNMLALQNEQKQLTDRNQELESSKRRLADELREKGRRAGIPAGYLRF